jgi:hypothetical protein
MRITNAPFLKTFSVTLLVVNAPVLGFLAPILRILLFLPVLFWINIPGTPLGLLLGEPLYEFHEFGVVPQNALAWVLIEVAWIVIAFGVSMAWLRRRWFFRRVTALRPRNGDGEESRDAANLS